MEVTINTEKKSIVIDDRLIFLGNSLGDNLLEVNLKPEGVKYLGSIENLSTEDIRMVWGWSELDIKLIDPPYLLSELEEIKYDNNLDSLLNYDSGVIAPIVFLFPCVECIRSHYNKPVYLIYDNEDNVKGKIFI
jgi:hypothetical protein